MRATAIVTTLTLVLGAFTAPTPAQDVVVQLKYKPVTKFGYALPEEVWSPATNLAIHHSGGDRFASEAGDESLRVDTDGDGELDLKVQGATGYALLKGRRDDVSKFVYAVRFRQTAALAYEYASSGVMTGSLNGVSIELIDRDNDGVWNEVGVDALVVGGGTCASYLSSVVNLKGELFSIEVDATGRTLTASPFTGESGSLKLRGGLALPGKLIAAVVSDSSRRYSFEVGNVAELRVPAGSYTFSGGLATSGSDTASLRSGKMQPMVVAAGGSATTQWGAPLVAEFDYQRHGETLTVQPDVKWYGRGGEEWHTLLPDAKSPKLLFLDKSNGKLLASKRFEGC